MSARREVALARVTLRASLTILALLAVTACDGTGSGFNGLEETFVGVTLTEFTLTPDPTAASDDDPVHFFVENEGAVAHDFLVVKTNLPAGALPSSPDGSYVEDAAGTEIVGRLVNVDPGQVNELRIDLSAGNYVLICNVVDGSGSHYALGMRALFTVT